MKRTLSLSLAVCLTTALAAQTLVGTAPTPKNIVMEKFTGINCPQCPGGATSAQTLVNTYPGRVNIINMHSDYGGSCYYTKPQNTSQPDLRVSASYPIQQMINKIAFPTAILNRRTWTGTEWTAPYYTYGPTKYGIGSPGFINAGAEIINNGGNSDVNIGVKTTWDSLTRELTIDIELYYVVGQSVNNELNVALTQSNIIGYQASGGTNYNHKHTLRHFITGQWGEVLTAPTQGQLITKQYKYTVPASYGYSTSAPIPCNINDCDIVVYVTDNAHHNTHTGITVKAKNSEASTTTGVKENIADISNLIVFPNPIDATSTVTFYLNDEGKTTIELYNILGSRVFVEELGNLNKGTYTISPDFINNKPAPGTYLMKINSANTSSFTKIVL